MLSTSKPSLIDWFNSIEKSMGVCFDVEQPDSNSRMRSFFMRKYFPLDN